MANKFLDNNGLLYFWQKIVNKIKDNIENSLTSTSVDKSLSAYQGKVLNDKIDGINTNLENLGAGDMLKSKYDTDDNGQVDKADNADKFGGQTPDYYAKATDLNDYVSTAKVGQANGVASLGADGKVPESQLPETAPIEHTHEIADINKLQDELDEMVAVAQGKCKSYVFDTVDALDVAIAEYIAFINSGTEMSTTNPFKGETLKTGDVFLIRAVNVPDYWWDGNTNGKCVLETTKVDLTTITNAEIDAIVAS